jgi:hypothetical protein
MESSPSRRPECVKFILTSTTSKKSSSPPDQKEAHTFSGPTSASIIAYMKHVLDVEQVPYEDQTVSDIVMITNYDLRN